MSIRLAAPTTINAGTSATGWASATGGCVVSLDTSGHPALMDGTTVSGLVKSVGNGAGGLNRFNYAPAGGVSFAGKRGIECDIYVDPASFADTKPAAVYLQMFLAQDAGFTNYVTVVYQALLVPGWNRVRITRTDLTAVTGTIDWSATWAVVRFNFGAVAAKTVTVWVANLRYAGASRAQCPIVFDDAFASVYSVAFPYMAARGIVGTIAVIQSYVGTANYCTEAQLKEMQAAGWAMVNHTKTHQQNVLNAASQAVCYAEINDNITYLASLGFTRDDEHLFFCAPYGEWSDNYLAAARQANCKMHRTTVHTDSTQVTNPMTSDYPGNLFPIGIVGVVNTWTVASLKVNLIAMAQRGSAASTGFLFHELITPTAVSRDYDIADFKLFIDQCYRLKSAMDFPTLPQLYNRWMEVGAA